MVAKIFFITGTSGTGKTTLAKELKKEKIPNLNIYDFDEVGVPENPPISWRLETTNYWLKVAKENLNKNKSAIICGVSVPTEIQESKEFSEELNIFYGLLEISQNEIRKRLNKRKWTNELIEENISWTNSLKRNIVEQENHFIINSENNNPNEIAKIVLNFAKSKINT